MTSYYDITIFSQFISLFLNFSKFQKKNSHLCAQRRVFCKAAEYFLCDLYLKFWRHRCHHKPPKVPCTRSSTTSQLSVLFLEHGVPRIYDFRKKELMYIIFKYYFLFYFHRVKDKKQTWLISSRLYFGINLKSFTTTEFPPSANLCIWNFSEISQKFHRHFLENIWVSMYDE